MLRRILSLRCGRSDRNPRFDHVALSSRLALMSKLEASLEASLRALLALDLSEIERRTKEQAALSTELAAVRMQSPASSEPAAAGKVSDLFQESQSMEFRILDALRLQSAVLKRSQSKLRVMANMLADPSAAYTRPPAQRRLVRASQAFPDTDHAV
jgi:hypothetical protein